MEYQITVSMTVGGDAKEGHAPSRGANPRHVLIVRGTSCALGNHRSSRPLPLTSNFQRTAALAACWFTGTRDPRTFYRPDTPPRRAVVGGPAMT